MKNLNSLDKYRRMTQDVLSLYGTYGNEKLGVFDIPSVMNPNAILKIIAVAGGEWDHVSISLPHRVPSWQEMQQVHRLFFRDDEIAVQYHMPAGRHINNHPNVLHLWRPHDAVIPTPPSEYV